MMLHLTFAEKIGFYKFPIWADTLKFVLCNTITTQLFFFLLPSFPSSAVVEAACLGDQDSLKWLRVMVIHETLTGRGQSPGPGYEETTGLLGNRGPTCQGSWCEALLWEFTQCLSLSGSLFIKQNTWIKGNEVDDKLLKHDLNWKWCWPLFLKKHCKYFTNLVNDYEL